jgi:hypothetical protein
VAEHALGGQKQRFWNEHVNISMGDRQSCKDSHETWRLRQGSGIRTNWLEDQKNVLGDENGDTLVLSLY